ncbi:MAG TPA: cation:proton antiporter [bacterium]|nr:cation:proton antiporter [bacterium]HQL64098.1 cation:proton antiporter [bacterium]
MDAWSTLTDVSILLAAALALGTIAEELRQSAIIGYLLAGMLVGPNMLGWVTVRGEVNVIAELGVALLLFTIGLEFSFRRLLSLGPITFVGGTAQVLITCVVGWWVATAFGCTHAAGIVIGGIVAMSSTACVLKVLMSMTATDSPMGRNAIGILLLQDMAVVPLVLVVSSLGSGDGIGRIAWTFFRTLGLGGLLFAVLYVCLNYFIPSLLTLRSWSRNRELPTLLAIVTAIGSALAAHRAGLSPAFGAFLSGLLLAESPFAAQIRADIGSLRAVLMTLFFAAIGMLGNPAWAVEHWVLVLVLVSGIVVGKTLLIWAIVRAFGFSSGLALATSLCLAQVGEFSFVLAQIALTAGILDIELFRLIITATVVTLFLAPYLVRLAPGTAYWLETASPIKHLIKSTSPAEGVDPAVYSSSGTRQRQDIILVVGFGPAGQGVVETLLAQHRDRLMVIDLNPQNVRLAKGYGIEAHIGDAGHPDVLDHLHISAASVVVVTLPDPLLSRRIIHLCRSLAPQAKIIARARYNRFESDLREAGAEAIINEEKSVGLLLAQEVQKTIGG